MMLGVMTLSYPLIDFIYGGGGIQRLIKALTALRAMFFYCPSVWWGYACQQ